RWRIQKLSTTCAVRLTYLRSSWIRVSAPPGMSDRIPKFLGPSLVATIQCYLEPAFSSRERRRPTDGQSVQEPQYCVRADWYIGFARQPRATLAAGLQRECRQQIVGAVSPPRIASQSAIEALAWFWSSNPRGRPCPECVK